MKASLEEFDGCFGITLTAESIDDANKIVRAGLGHTKDLRCFRVNVFRFSERTGADNSDNFILSVVVGRKKNISGTIG